MNFQTLDVTVDARNVCHLRLNTPEKRNVLSAQMIAELTQAAAVIGSDDTVRAVILSGEGKLFCAGGDLNWMKAQQTADRAQRMTEARKLADMLRALNAMPKPLIGKIHGGAFGGGVGLACVCDVAIAEASASFAFSETRLGIIPATIGPYVIARMGEGKARGVFMSGRVFQAGEAVDLGIVARSVGTVGELDEAVEAEVKPYLSAAPRAVGRAKRLALSLGSAIDDAAIEASIEALADAWEDEEAMHGISAFLSKQPPRWA